MENIILLGIITAGVFLGNILSKDWVLFFPKYIWYIISTSYNIKSFNNKYKRYLSDKPLEIKRGRNIIILCYGRDLQIKYTDIINYKIDNVKTIDIDKHIHPHYVIDLSQKDCLKQFGNKSIDIIICNFCNGCAMDIYSNPFLAGEIFRIIKKDGELWFDNISPGDYTPSNNYIPPNYIIPVNNTKSPLYDMNFNNNSDNLSSMDWELYFEYDRSITSNKTEKMKIIKSYTSYFNDQTFISGDNLKFHEKDNIKIWKPFNEVVY